MLENISLPPFQGFQKIPRLSREIVITEKIDGTNAIVFIDDLGKNILAGSRSRWLTPKDDNHSFAKWVEKNKEELLTLGPGTHFGEWWGQGIQRKYGMTDKKFSLFNVHRWENDLTRPRCCNCVPVLYRGVFDTQKIDDILSELKTNGSVAKPGFMNPEGIVIYHVAGGHLYKKTLDNNDGHKG